MKKSLIHKNKTNNEILWVVDSVETDLTVKQYLKVVDIGFSDDLSNFKWVDQPEEVSKRTHKYTEDGFVLIIETK